MQPQLIQKPSFQTRITRWIHAHPARIYTFAAIGLVVAGAVITMAVLWQRPEKIEAPAPTDKAVAPAPKPIYYSPLTGEIIPDQAAATKPVTAIMIENSPDARPQSGLKDAEIVYEAIAEGGITRFLTLYQQRQPENVGPVRSLRMYYMDWLTPYQASVAHVGGSAAALQLVRNGSYRDIDQFFNPGTYRRVTDRSAPHNVYTSFSKLNELNAAKGFTTSSPAPMERTDDQSDLPQDATQISLKISGPTYNPSYAYDATSKQYLRSQAGAPHLDREAGQIQAKVVVAMKVSMQRVLEDGYRESVGTIGSGEAVIFQNGHASAVIWHKDSREAQLRFTDPATGQPFKLARGTTWISAIPATTGAITWQ